MQGISINFLSSDSYGLRSSKNRYAMTKKIQDYQQRKDSKICEKDMF